MIILRLLHPRHIVPVSYTHLDVYKRQIFAYPKLNIREQMAAYQEVIDRSALNDEKLRLPASREDR